MCECTQYFPVRIAVRAFFADRSTLGSKGHTLTLKSLPPLSCKFLAFTCVPSSSLLNFSFHVSLSDTDD